MAAAAGVSVATASRVLGGSDRTVAPDNARRVLEAAAALHYTADAAARAMRRRSDAIALIADDLTTSSIAVTVAAMERRARLADAFVTVSQTRGDPEKQLSTVRAVRAFRPRALVLTSSRISPATAGGRLLDELLAYESQGGRVVLFGGIDMPFDSIGVDDEGSAALLGAHVRALGHRHVAILAGPASVAFAASRTAGFVSGLGSSVTVERVPCEVTRDGGYAAAAGLVAAGLTGIEAVMAVNDAVAVGALAAFLDAGVPVPSRISLTGFDDVPLSSDVFPRLTTVALPFAAIGERLTDLALLTGPPSPGRESVHGTLIPRESTRAAPAPSN
ncbi:LacI family DNA-binding transcriptional regulator [Catenuloplanes japonicus]|uniref:LacI family DNA-binding transcriptional regulator n=1 Tax=Catenuloplanes japonicus TaxID=33876 RepID=UPI00068AB028|nr:LacI family DNA-binding transcriptional regulator [Catenuloplanes japonicus]